MNDVLIFFPYHEPWETMYKTAVEPAVQASGMNAVRADEIARICVPFEPAKLTFRRAQGLSIIPETQTEVGEYRNYTLGNSRIGVTLLTYIHHYKKEQVKKALENHGFVVKEQFTNDRTVLFFLAKRDESF